MEMGRGPNRPNWISFGGRLDQFWHQKWAILVPENGPFLIQSWASSWSGNDRPPGPKLNQSPTWLWAQPGAEVVPTHRPHLYGTFVFALSNSDCQDIVIATSNGPPACLWPQRLGHGTRESGLKNEQGVR